MGWRRELLHLRRHRHGDGARRRELGKTVLKRRQLGALGWRPVAVPFFEWDVHNPTSRADAPRADSDRDAYLKAKLADARSAVPEVAVSVTPALSYPQLQAECKRLGLPAKGKAAVLRERIAAHRAGGG